ncbi:MAG: DUF6428 family protein [Pseudomonadota bacterium]
MTLYDLFTTLRRAEARAELVFAMPDGEIGAGFHVTELKSAEITSIDCGGRVTRFRETILQILDGLAGDPFTVGKFLGICAQSVAAIEALGDAPLTIEGARANAGLARYEVADIVMARDRVVVHLATQRAQCKPATQRAQCKPAASHCCPPPADKPTAPVPCCA